MDTWDLCVARVGEHDPLALGLLPVEDLIVKVQVLGRHFRGFSHQVLELLVQFLLCSLFLSLVLFLETMLLPGGLDPFQDSLFLFYALAGLSFRLETALGHERASL